MCVSTILVKRSRATIDTLFEIVFCRLQKKLKGKNWRSAVRDSQCYWKQQVYTLTKYDFLVTEVQDKLVQTIQLLQEDNEIEPELSLREVYDKYFHPNVLPLNDQKIWDALGKVSVINTFQFDSQVGAQVAKKLKPQNVLEMADANGSTIGPYTLYL